jgi:predicted acylesterase/phospholipase RssA
MAEQTNNVSSIQTARNILRGQAATIPVMAELAARLKKEKHFGYARQLLARARSIPADIPADLRLYLCQQHALCTYKDTHLPVGKRYDDALRILSEVEDLRTTRTQETLGLAGAIYKSKWDSFGQKPDLELSAEYYLRGYREGGRQDLGYTGINAAFVLDLLASQEATPETAGNRRDQAKAIREDLVKVLAPLAADPAQPQLATDWWFLATLAEAYFGLGDYDQARAWILRARDQAQPADWELEATLRQLAKLARLQAAAGQVAGEDMENSPGWRVLAAIAGPDKTAGVRGALIGRVGLALSGGGFRASLFHIGVLAKLAELDALRHVETLSCVSGGSIVGAHYYLEVQQLLRTKRDNEISREDYIAIVQRMLADFLAGVQTNIRTRVFANLRVNLKMAFSPGYSRTEHVGELYEENIFSRAGDRKPRRAMSDLLIHPLGETDDFTPEAHNWRRGTKVPMLVLNATTLNTGHNWQFTATWMGEPTAGIDSEVDANYRLRRMYYGEAPEPYRRYPLGQAVAASSCVPGLFEPMNLPNLYPGIDLLLVDGGVHDNQGIGALLDEGCTVLLVSDASGQMESQNRPGNGIFSSLMRASSILGARVRGAEYEDVAARRLSSQLRGLMFIHLKKGLDVLPVDWIGCEDPSATAAQPYPLTPYGIRKDMQERIAAIRTDLDSFHDVEAYALMTSGYRMAEYEFPRSIQGFPRTAPVSIAWPFLAVEAPLKGVAGIDRAHRDLMELLQAANCMAFKIWKLSPVLRGLGWVLIGAAVLGLLGIALWGPKVGARLTLQIVLLAGIAMVAASILGKKVVHVVRFRDTLKQIAAGLALCVCGPLIGGIHLAIFDKLYLRRGSIQGLRSKLSAKDGGAA